jgi:hypothetical protein
VNPGGYDPLGDSLKGCSLSIRVEPQGPWSFLQVLPLAPLAYRASALLMS